MDIQLSARGAAAAATWIFSGALATPPRPRRGYSVETSRGDAAVGTWIFRGDKECRGNETGACALRYVPRNPGQPPRVLRGHPRRFLRARPRHPPRKGPGSLVRAPSDGQHPKRKHARARPLRDGARRGARRRRGSPRRAQRDARHRADPKEEDGRVDDGQVPLRQVPRADDGRRDLRPLAEPARGLGRAADDAAPPFFACKRVRPPFFARGNAPSLNVSPSGMGPR